MKYRDDMDPGELRNKASAIALSRPCKFGRVLNSNTVVDQTHLSQQCESLGDNDVSHIAARYSAE